MWLADGIAKRTRAGITQRRHVNRFTVAATGSEFPKTFGPRKSQRRRLRKIFDTQGAKKKQSEAKFKSGIHGRAKARYGGRFFCREN